MGQRCDWVVGDGGFCLVAATVAIIRAIKSLGTIVRVGAATVIIISALTFVSIVYAALFGGFMGHVFFPLHIIKAALCDFNISLDWRF